MILEKLKLRNFRLYPSFKVLLKDGVNILTGKNGVGKTSILEAISLGSSAESFRFGKSEDFIRSGEDSSSIELKVKGKDYSDKIEVEITKKGKKLRLNNKKIFRARKLTEILPHIAFSPNDHKIIDGDSSTRRSFINKAISNVDFNYADYLQQYNKSLYQRNKLLKLNRAKTQEIEKIAKEVNVWDEQLAFFGEKIIFHRKEYIGKLLPFFKEQYKCIAKKEAALRIDYMRNTKEKYMLESSLDGSSLLKQLNLNLFQDLLYGSTRVGPHKDEILFVMDGNRMKSHSSQGEKRTAVLALRLAEVDLYGREKKDIPILLIDDISSELDLFRREALIDLLKKGDSQALITATEFPFDILKEVKNSINHYDLDLIKMDE